MVYRLSAVDADDLRLGILFCERVRKAVCVGWRSVAPRKQQQHAEALRVHVLRKLQRRIVRVAVVDIDCVADKADILYAKSHLLQYCKANEIECMEFKNFGDIDISDIF